MQVRNFLGPAILALFLLVAFQGARWLLSVLEYRAVCNPHYFFGLWEGGGLVLAASGGLVALSLFLSCLARERLEQIGWSIIALSGLSNLGERLFFGCVTDYFFLPFWPAFNLADMFLSFGAILCFSSFLRSRL